VVTVGRLRSFGPHPLKFFIFWAENAEFLNWVEEGWRLVEGVPMFRLYARLKAVKHILKDKTWVFIGLSIKLLLNLNKDWSKLKERF
jgi:hypothetical protein